MTPTPAAVEAAIPGLEKLIEYYKGHKDGDNLIIDTRCAAPITVGQLKAIVQAHQPPTDALNNAMSDHHAGAMQRALGLAPALPVGKRFVPRGIPPDVSDDEIKALDDLHKEQWGDDAFWVERIIDLWNEYLPRGFDDVLEVIKDRFGLYSKVAPVELEGDHVPYRVSRADMEAVLRGKIVGLETKIAMLEKAQSPARVNREFSDTYAETEHGKVVLVARQKTINERCLTHIEFNHMGSYETAFLKVALDNGLNRYLLQAAGCGDDTPEITVDKIPATAEQLERSKP